MAKIDNVLSNRVPSIASANEAGLPIVFDTILREDHRRESQISSYPTETSVNGNDHTIHKNPTLTLTVGVSDNPIKMATAAASANAITGFAGAGVGIAGGMLVSKFGGLAAAAVGAAASATISAMAGSDRRSVDVWKALEYMRLTSSPVNIVGTKDDYKGYRIVRLSETVEKEVEGGAIFEIGLEKPRIFSTSSSAAVINANLRKNDPVATRGAARVDNGNVGISDE